MAQRGRPGLSASQKSELWERWKSGQSHSDIGRAFRTHSPTDFGLAPSSIAIADIVRSLCFTSFAVSALNSSVNRLRLLFLVFFGYLELPKEDWFPLGCPAFPCRVTALC